MEQPDAAARAGSRRSGIRRDALLGVMLSVCISAACVLPEVQLSAPEPQSNQMLPVSEFTTPREPPKGEAQESEAGAQAPDPQPSNAATAGSSGGSAGVEGGGRGGSDDALVVSGTSAPSGLCSGRPCLQLGAQCTADSQCESASCMQSCRQPSTLGTSCDSKADCVAPLECSRISLCQRSLGAACAADSECASGSCLTSCQVSQSLGGPCDSDADCTDHTQCATRVCRAGLGTTCGRDADCVSGSCSVNTKQCQVPGADMNLSNGQACKNDVQCSSGSCGWDHMCSNPVGSAYNCDSDADCMSGLHCYRPDPSDPGGYCQ